MHLNMRGGSNMKFSLFLLFLILNLTFTAADTSKGKIIKTYSIFLAVSIFLFMAVALCRYIRNPEGKMGKQFAEISYRELQKATDFFSEGALVGTGAYGRVYKATTKNGTFAIKRLHSWKKECRKQFETEIQILSAAAHPNLVKLLGWCLNGEEMLLIYEFVPNGTLMHHIHGGSISWEIRLRIAVETTEALVFLHRQISHRDIKSSNILLDDDFHVKLGDFGISKLLPNIDLTQLTTTIGYLDPQYYENYDLSNESDVYSFGVVLVELITGMKVLDLSRSSNEVWLASFALSKDKCQLAGEFMDAKLICEDDNLMNIVRHQAQKMAEIALQCLAHDKHHRPNMIEVLNHLNSIAGN